MAKLSHLDDQGRAKMVDVSDKEVTSRIAVARGAIQMRPETLALIREGKVKKGDVFSVARVAGIMAAKKTSELIPMCHPLNITSVEIDLSAENNPARVEIEATVRVAGKTGVWVGDKKIASIGIACRTWVTFHGLALNVEVISDQRLRGNRPGQERTPQELRDERGGD